MDKFRDILTSLATYQGEDIIVTVKAPNLEGEGNVTEFTLTPIEAEAAYHALDELVSEHEGYEALAQSYEG